MIYFSQNQPTSVSSYKWLIYVVQCRQNIRCRCLILSMSTKYVRVKMFPQRWIEFHFDPYLGKSYASLLEIFLAYLQLSVLLPTFRRSRHSCIGRRHVKTCPLLPDWHRRLFHLTTLSTRWAKFLCVVLMQIGLETIRTEVQVLVF